MPNITSNTSYGVISASSESNSSTMAAWRVFDGVVYNPSANTYKYNSWRAVNGQALPAFWKWELPETIYLNSITITKGGAGSIYTCQIFSDSNGTVPISEVLSFSTSDSSVNTQVTAFFDAVPVNCIYIKILSNRSNSAVAISEISIDAEVLD